LPPGLVRGHTVVALYNNKTLWPDFGYQGSQGVGSYTLVSNSEQEVYTSPYFRDHNGDFAVNCKLSRSAEVEIGHRAAILVIGQQLFPRHHRAGGCRNCQQ
jgi:hypothetical protein